MANILLTNQCNQKCTYCFAEKEMRKKGNEMSLKNFRAASGFLEKSKDNNIRLMGGEPTLHSKFEEAVDYSLSQGFSVQVFTNGLFSSEILNFLNKKKDKIKYSFNLNPPKDYSASQWKLILKNLETLSQYNNCLIGRVIWKNNFSIDYLLNLAKKFPIKVIMLRPANPPVDRQLSADNIIGEIKRANEAKIRIGFGCGFSKKMFNKRQLKILKEYNVTNLKWGCDGNSGCFDIGTDLSVFRCFPLSDWKKKRLTDFNNSQEIENCFNKAMEKYQVSNSKTDFIHQGPCFSYLLSKEK